MDLPDLEVLKAEVEQTKVALEEAEVAVAEAKAAYDATEQPPLGTGDMACSMCKASEGEPCKTRLGRHAPNHTVRIAALREHPDHVKWRKHRNELLKQANVANRVAFGAEQAKLKAANAVLRATYILAKVEHLRGTDLSRVRLTVVGDLKDDPKYRLVEVHNTMVFEPGEVLEKDLIQHVIELGADVVFVERSHAPPVAMIAPPWLGFR